MLPRQVLFAIIYDGTMVAEIDRAGQDDS